MSADFPPPSAHRSPEQLTNFTIEDVLGQPEIPTMPAVSESDVLNVMESHTVTQLREAKISLENRLESLIGRKNELQEGDAKQALLKQITGTIAELSLYQQALAMKLDTSS